MTSQKSADASLARNFLWSAVGNVVYAGSQWALLTVLTKLGTPDMVGQFALSLSLTAPVIMFLNLQLRSVQATDVRGEYHFSDYLGLRMITVLVSFVVFLIFATFGGYRPEIGLLIVIVGAAKLFESASDIYYGLFQLHQRLDMTARSMMIKGPLSVVVLAAGVYMTGDLIWGVSGLALVWLLLWVLFDVPRARRLLIDSGHCSLLRPRWQWTRLRALVILTLPLGVVMGLMSFNTNIPRYFLERHSGEYALGIFSALSYVMAASNLVLASLGASSSAQLAKHYATGNRAAFMRLQWRMIGFGLLCGIAGVMVAAGFGRPILSLLYSAEYAEHNNVFVLCMVAAAFGFVAMSLTQGITAARLFRAQLPLHALVAVIAILGSVLVVESRGLVGAAEVLLLSNATQVAGSALLLSIAVRRMKQEAGPETAAS